VVGLLYYSLESSWITAAETPDKTGSVELSSHAMVKEAAFHDRWIGQLNSLPVGGKRSLHQYWKRKNAALELGNKIIRNVS